MKEQVEFTKVFEVKVGQKVTQEFLDAIEKDGFLEFSRKDIKGGYEATFAKKKNGIIQSEDGKKKKVNVFLLDEMPADELMTEDAGFPLQHNVHFLMNTAKGIEPLVGTYGLANGRKFFCIGETKVKTTKETKPSDTTKSADKKPA